MEHILHNRNFVLNKINKLDFNEIIKDMMIENLKPYMYNKPFDIHELSKNTSTYSNKFLQQIKDKIRINKIVDEKIFYYGIQLIKFSKFFDIPSNDVGLWSRSSKNKSKLSENCSNELIDFLYYNDNHIHDKDIIPDTSDSLYMILNSICENDEEDDEYEKIRYVIETDENIRNLINIEILQILCLKSSHIFHNIIKSFEDKLDSRCWNLLCTHNPMHPQIHPTIKELIKNNLNRLDFHSKISLYTNSCNDALDLIQIDLNNILDIKLLNALCDNSNDKTYDILNQYVERLDISCWMKLCENKNKVIFNLIEQNLDKLDESCWKILWSNPNIFVEYDYDKIKSSKFELHEELKSIRETELYLLYLRYNYDIINECETYLNPTHAYNIMKNEK